MASGRVGMQTPRRLRARVRGMSARGSGGRAMGSRVNVFWYTFIMVCPRPVLHMLDRVFRKVVVE